MTATSNTVAAVQSPMKLARAAGALVFVFMLLPLNAAVLGVFQGTIVEAVPSQRRAGWIYVESHNGQVRHVEIHKARVIYSARVPAGRRHKIPRHDLRAATVVVVTAEEDKAGNWHAHLIEIVVLPRQHSGQRLSARAE